MTDLEKNEINDLRKRLLQYENKMKRTLLYVGGEHHNCNILQWLKDIEKRINNQNIDQELSRLIKKYLLNNYHEIKNCKDEDIILLYREY